MNRPQHALQFSSVHETSSRSSTVLYLDPLTKALMAEDPLGVRSDENPVRSSWALNSRLHRLKKRHTPALTMPASSSSTVKSSSDSNCARKSSLQKKNKRASKQQQEHHPSAGHSRWESLPPLPRALCQQPGEKRRSSRPTLPKRQHSIESSPTRENDDASSRKAFVNRAAACGDKALRSYHRRSCSNEAFSAETMTFSGTLCWQSSL